MAKYEVFNKPSARKELQSVGTKHDRQKIVAAIQGLAIDARSTGSQKLVTRNIRDFENLPGVVVLEYKASWRSRLFHTFWFNYSQAWLWRCE